jgi:cobaltochelatase CobS
MYDANRLSFSARGKSAMRSAITSNTSWPLWAKLNEKSSANLTIPEMVSLCQAWHIDASGYAKPNYAEDAGEAKERPYHSGQVYDLRQRFDALAGLLTAKASNLCYDIFSTAKVKQENTMSARQYGVISSILDAAEGKETPRFYRKRKDNAAAMTPPPPAYVPPAVPTPPANDMAAQLATLLAGIAGQSLNADAIGRIVDERINAALSAVPAVRFEVKGYDGQVRNLDGHKHPKFALLLKAATARMANGYAPNIWIAGPAGSGKTHGGHMLADAFGADFHLNGAISMPHELLGFIDAGGKYHSTPFRQAYEHGGVYMFDEVDGSDNAALLALNAALANGHCAFPDQSVTRHKDCVILASANTWGLGATAEYVGRSKIDAAFMSRFPVRVSWEYDNALEVAISGNASFARRVIAARERARAAGLKVLIDPRASQAGAALIANGLTEIEAADATYLANLTADQRRIVEGA